MGLRVLRQTQATAAQSLGQDHLKANGVANGNREAIASTVKSSATRKKASEVPRFGGKSPQPTININTCKLPAIRLTRSKAKPVNSPSHLTSNNPITSPSDSLATTKQVTRHGIVCSAEIQRQATWVGLQPAWTTLRNSSNLKHN